MGGILGGNRHNVARLLAGLGEGTRELLLEDMESAVFPERIEALLAHVPAVRRILDEIPESEQPLAFQVMRMAQVGRIHAIAERPEHPVARLKACGGTLNVLAALFLDLPDEALQQYLSTGEEALIESALRRRGLGWVQELSDGQHGPVSSAQSREAAEKERLLTELEQVSGLPPYTLARGAARRDTLEAMLEASDGVTALLGGFDDDTKIALMNDMANTFLHDRIAVILHDAGGIRVLMDAIPEATDLTKFQLLRMAGARILEVAARHAPRTIERIGKFGEDAFLTLQALLLDLPPDRSRMALECERDETALEILEELRPAICEKALFRALAAEHENLSFSVVSKVWNADATECRIKLDGKAQHQTKREFLSRVEALFYKALGFALSEDGTEAAKGDKKIPLGKNLDARHGRLRICDDGAAALMDKMRERGVPIEKIPHGAIER